MVIMINEVPDDFNTPEVLVNSETFQANTEDNNCSDQARDQCQDKIIDSVPQEQYTELEQKYQELRVIQEQYTELEQKYQELRVIQEEYEQKFKEQNQELIAVKAKLKELEDMNKSKFDNLIQDSLRKDADNWQEDNLEYQKYLQQREYWQSKNEALFSELSSIIPECVNHINQSGEFIQKFTDIHSLDKHLSNRHESLQLIRKMLERLPIDKLKTSNLPPTDLVKTQETELLSLVQSQTDEKQAKILLEKKIRELENNRNQSIRECRDLSENLQKKWLHFLEKQFLLVVDGIDSGEKYSQDLMADLKENYPSHHEELSNWLQTYSHLKVILLKSLENLGITPINVEIGKPVDYLLHDPISTEEDANLSNESVKEVTRHGYEYKQDLLDKSLILRSAQVVVVKNN
jgi:molecular chaperone GrpE (heat shock protein)